MGLGGKTRVAVVVPAYRRADLLLELLRQLPADRVSRVYISIDGPATGAEHDVNACREVAEEYAQSAPFPVLVHALPENVGAAANVLGAVSWMLRHEDRGAVLEDDCHPIPEFFDFVRDALDAYALRPEVWLVCGTQFAPAELIDGSHVLSPYPLIWGWATTADKWALAMADLQQSLLLTRPRLVHRLFPGPVDRFWISGHRRAAQGRVDAWDLPLVQVMRLKAALAVLPRTSLVSNVGDDARATHTAAEQRWTRSATLAVPMPLVEATPAISRTVAKWLERNVYEIGLRHCITTIVRRVLDMAESPMRAPLLQRLEATERLWNEAPGPPGVN